MVNLKKDEKSWLRETFEKISPVLVRPSGTSVTVGLSKRFMLFDLLGKITKQIEDDPHVNFVSLLKYYKVLGRFLEGTIYEFYRDRNKAYFKHFFLDKQIWKMVKADLEYVYKINKQISLTITKEGIVVYDNYKKNKFNTLLLTIHSGTFVPPHIQKRMKLSKDDRRKEEDVGSNYLYCELVLEQGGIWIDNKCSRFYCDLNRNLARCIYTEDSHNRAKDLWKDDLSKRDVQEIHGFYSRFYSMLTRLLESYSFNVIFDAHTMRHEKGRPDMSFGTLSIPKFYLPIVKSMRSKIRSLGYEKVAVNKPYGGGFILKWLSTMYPNLFIFSMEVNKRLYMSKNRMKVFPTKLKKIAGDLNKIFDISEDDEFRHKN